MGRFAYRHRLAIVLSGCSASCRAAGDGRRFPGGSRAAATRVRTAPRSAPSACSSSGWRRHLARHDRLLSDDLPAPRARFEELQARALERLSPETLPGLVGVDTAASTGWSDLVAEDGRAALALLEFDLSIEETQEHLPRLRELLRRPGSTRDDRRRRRLRRCRAVSARDLRVAESYALPIAADRARARLRKSRRRRPAGGRRRDLRDRARWGSSICSQGSPTCRSS